MRRLRVLLLAFVLAGLPLLLAACNESEDGGGQLVLSVPSDTETVFGEKRDFYVIGYFNEPLAHPGDVRVELYAGDKAEGAPLRVVTSSVDPDTGLTPESALRTDYPEGLDRGLSMVPDLVMEPGGFDFPGNKCVVTTTYYAALVLGGATKDFDTDYLDAEGQPMADLAAGTYTLKVSGLSGALEGKTAVKRLTFGLTHAMLGRFSPTAHRDRLVAYGREKGYRLYLDPFPGILYIGSVGYEVGNRWRPNNAIEVVNNLSGNLLDTVSAAQNDILLYNVSPTSATQMTETGTLVFTDMIDDPATSLHYYDIGEPGLSYVEAGSSEVVVLEGSITDLAFGDRLALYRAEVLADDGADRDNLYTPGDPTPRLVDTDVSDGVVLGSGQELDLYGLCAPIPSATQPGEYHNQYVVTNRVAAIHYVVRDGDGAAVLDTTREVNLGRIYDASQPERVSRSIYEFKHDLALPAAGSYVVHASGLDVDGALVDGAAESFPLTVGP